MDVRIDIDTKDREATITSLCAAIEQASGLPRSASEEGVALAFDGYRAAIDALLKLTEPDKVGIPTSAAFLFAWTMIMHGHAKAKSAEVLQMIKAASLIHRLDSIVGAD